MRSAVPKLVYIIRVEGSKSGACSDELAHWECPFCGRHMTTPSHEFVRGWQDTCAGCGVQVRLEIPRHLVSDEDLSILEGTTQQGAPVRTVRSVEPNPDYS